VQLEQRAAGGLDQVAELGGRGLDPLVDPLQLRDQFRGQLAAGLAHQVTRTDGGQQGFGLGRGQERLGPARDQFDQQPVQPVDREGAGGSELVTSVHQQPQRDCRAIDLHGAKTWRAQRDQRDRVRVGGVGLAALPGGEHPSPRRQLRRYVHHRFTVGDQPLGDVATHSFASFHRPHPVRPPPAGGQQVLVAVAVGAEPARREDLLRLVEDLDRRRPLVRIHPDCHLCHDPRLLLAIDSLSTRRAALLRAGQTPLEPHLVTGARRYARHERATPTSRGQPMRERPRRTPRPQPGQARAVGPVNK